jgi:hypothetical protein
VQRKAPHFESYVTPLPEVYKTDPVPPQAQTSANPYTYAVHAVSVTPSPYHGPSTPVPPPPPALCINSVHRAPLTSTHVRQG